MTSFPGHQQSGTSGRRVLWLDLSVLDFSVPVLVLSWVYLSKASVPLSLLPKLLNPCFLLKPISSSSEPSPPASSYLEASFPGSISSKPCPLASNSFQPGLPVSKLIRFWSSSIHILRNDLQLSCRSEHIPAESIFWLPGPPASFSLEPGPAVPCFSEPHPLISIISEMVLQCPVPPSLVLQWPVCQSPVVQQPALLRSVLHCPTLQSLVL